MERNIVTSDEFMNYIRKEISKIDSRIDPSYKCVVDAELEWIETAAKLLCARINCNDRYDKIVLAIRYLAKGVNGFINELNIDGIINNTEYFQYKNKSEKFFSDLEKEYDKSVA